MSPFDLDRAIRKQIFQFRFAHLQCCPKLVVLTPLLSWVAGCDIGCHTVNENQDILFHSINPSTFSAVTELYRIFFRWATVSFSPLRYQTRSTRVWYRSLRTRPESSAVMNGPVRHCDVLVSTQQWERDMNRRK